jgi:hypothetical protein
MKIHTDVLEFQAMYGSGFYQNKQTLVIDLLDYGIPQIK